MTFEGIFNSYTVLIRLVFKQEAYQLKLWLLTKKWPYVTFNDLRDNQVTMNN